MEPIQITITIDPDQMLQNHYRYDPESDESQPLTSEEWILEMASKELAKVLSSDDYGTLRRIRNEAIERAVAKVVEEQLGRVLTPTNEFGRPIGESKTIEELIVEKAREWPEKVNGNTRRTNLQNAIEAEIGRAWTKELTAEVAKAKAKVLAAVTERAADVLGREIVDAQAAKG